jgi:tetraacyldisaccharide 4'-kinase
LHAVSVGEVLSAVRLLERLREEYPARPLYVSSTTLAGRALAEEKLRGLADAVFYAPIDYCFAVRRVLREIRPSVVMVLETEIWPNLYREAKRCGAGLVVVNGRVSDRAMPGYRRMKWFFRHVVDQPDAILAQDEVAAQRYLELGAPAERVRVGGNLKYEFDRNKLEPPEEVMRVIRNSAPDRVWIAASTMPPAGDDDVDEDDVVIGAFEQLAKAHHRMLLILVPRRPPRFPLAAEKLRDANVPFVRRSELSGEERIPLPGVLLLDSIGELSSLFGQADAVFMGGTLARRGGHNILEPAFFERPIVIGPHMENFQAIADEFLDGGAVAPIHEPAGLSEAVARLFEDEVLRKQLGERARRLAESKTGASERALDEVRLLSDHAVPRSVRPLLVRFVLWPFAQLWKLGWRWKMAIAVARRKRLSAPVVSVGGIGMGGSGKTPCVLHLAGRLKENGGAPAILTRGYRRRYPEKSSVLAAGASAAAELTGDEAQLFLRSGLAPVGIGADRYRTGRQLLQRHPSDVVLLDDGFQHWRLGRDVDLLLIDALDPFAGEALFPLGRLREPLEALARADAFMITRWEHGRPLAAIEERLHRYNPGAPIFLSRTVPLEWRNMATHGTADTANPSERHVAAFCGLANPASFWQTLAALDIDPIERWEFSDHHHYRPTQLRRIARHARAAGAEMLLTTEKDLMNLPTETPEIVKPLDVCWLRIGIEIENESELVELIQRRLRGRGGASSASRDRAEAASSSVHPSTLPANHPRR